MIHESSDGCREVNAGNPSKRTARPLDLMPWTLVLPQLSVCRFKLNPENLRLCKPGTIWARSALGVSAISAFVPDIQVVGHPRFAEALAPAAVAHRISAQSAPSVALEQIGTVLFDHVLGPFDGVLCGISGHVSQHSRAVNPMRAIDRAPAM